MANSLRRSDYARHTSLDGRRVGGARLATEIGDLRVLTVNTWAIRGRSKGARLTPVRLGELVRRLAELRPDVVLCQEVWRREEAGILKSAPGYPHHCQSDDYASDLRLGAGLLVLSRWPLGPATERTYSVDAPGKRTRRSALFSSVRLPGGESLFLVNTHLIDNPTATLGSTRNPLGEPMFLGGPGHDPLEANRGTQLRELFGWIHEHTQGPVVLGGDLNTGPQYPLFHAFLGEVAVTWPDLASGLSLPWGLPPTYVYTESPGGESEGQLDHVIGMRGAVITSAKVTLTEPFWAPLPWPRGIRWLHALGLHPGGARPVRSHVSDHFGVLAQVRVVTREGDHVPPVAG